MTNPKDSNSPPIPVPETMEEFREMARTAMALSVNTAANLDKRLDKVAEQQAKTSAQMAETSAQLAELRKQQAENSAQLAETRKQMAENSAQLAETRKQMAENSALLTKVIKRLDKAVEKLDKVADLSGNTNRNTGRLLEQEVIAQVDADRRIAWMRVDDVRANKTERVKRRVAGEHDLIAFNDDEVMVVEVKRVLRAREVREFARIGLAQFRSRFPEIAGKRAVYGAVAFALEEDDKEAREEAQDAAAEAGVMLIRAVGKTGLEFINPEREKLRNFG